MCAYHRSEWYRKHPNLLMVPPSSLALTHQTASNILHHTGQFRIRRMVQPRLFQKNNPDTHYANAVIKFMRERAVKNCQNIVFFSVDPKCKKKVIVGLNEKLMVTNHDFSKLSIIPDAYLLHEIPEKDELTDEKVNDDLLDKRLRLGEWYSG